MKREQRSFERGKVLGHCRVGEHKVNTEVRVGYSSVESVVIQQESLIRTVSDCILLEYNDAIVVRDALTKFIDAFETVDPPFRIGDVLYKSNSFINDDESDIKIVVSFGNRGISIYDCDDADSVYINGVDSVERVANVLAEFASGNYNNLSCGAIIVPWETQRDNTDLETCIRKSDDCINTIQISQIDRSDDGHSAILFSKRQACRAASALQSFVKRNGR